MKISILRICVQFLYFQNLTKCSLNFNDGINIIISSSSERSLAINKKKYIDYRFVRAHTRELTTDLDAFLTKKEEVLNTNTVYKWEDIHKYPLEQHAKYWDNFCKKLWPGIPGRIELEYFNVIRTCAAQLFPMGGRRGIKGGSFFRGFRHENDPNERMNIQPFTGDFVSCDCKYVRAGDNWAVGGSRRYFFAMKIGEREYFLLTKIYKANDERRMQTGTKLKIVDYVNLPESSDINLNT